MLFDAVIKIFWLYGHFGVKFKIDDIGFIFYEHQVNTTFAKYSSI